MRREYMIQALVLDSMDRMLVLGHYLWIHSVLENGFVGFAHMSDEELRHECARRALLIENDILRPGRDQSDEDPEESIEDLDFSDLISERPHSEMPE